MEKKNIIEYFEEVETTEEYNGYFFSVKAAITISISGTFCGLRNMKQIHQWASNITLSFDGKNVRSTAKMKAYKNPLHIVSAQIAELGITLGQNAVDSKSNEIPAVRELIEMLDITDCLIVADALNCQKDTAESVVAGNADYLFSVKDNQPLLKKDIEEYVQDEALRKTMETVSTTEKSRGRIETRTAYVTHETDWLLEKEQWVNIA